MYLRSSGWAYLGPECDSISVGAYTQGMHGSPHLYAPFFHRSKWALRTPQSTTLRQSTFRVLVLALIDRFLLRGCTVSGLHCSDPPAAPNLCLYSFLRNRVTHSRPSMPISNNLDLHSSRDRCRIIPSHSRGFVLIRYCLPVNCLPVNRRARFLATSLAGPRGLSNPFRSQKALAYFECH